MNPDELDDRLEQLYQMAKSASSEGLVDEAVRRCEEALELMESFGEDTDRHTYSDFVMLTGDVHWAAGDWEGAFQSYERVALNDPERHDAHLAMGVSLYHLCRFHSAQAVLERSSLKDPDDPEAWYYLGLLALRQEKTGLAMIFFENANELQEERFPVPVEISDEEIVEIVEKMIEEIPEDLRKSLDNVPILLQKRPDEAFLFSSDPPMDPTILGVFDGIPAPDMGSSMIVTAPSRIVLFAENIWLLASDRDKLEEELWITLKHEIGHFLGLSEEDLADRGLS